KNTKPVPVAKLEGEFDQALDRNRFTDQPVISYADGKHNFFALQLQPKLPDAEVMPIDYLLLIDTSASKAQGPLAAAQGIAAELVAQMGGADRVAIWTANLKPRDLSRGFKSAKELADTLKELAREVPLGAVNLKKCLGEAVDSFEVKSGRR